MSQSPNPGADIVALFKPQPPEEDASLNGNQKLPNLAAAALFSGYKSTYLNDYALFVAYFNALPNLISEVRIDCNKAGIWFAQTYKEAITNKHYCKRYYDERDNAPRLDDVFYTLHEDLLLNFDTNRSTIRFLFCKTPIQKVEALIAELKKFREREPKKRAHIGILVQNARGNMQREFLAIDKPRLCLEDNYNDDFAAIHKTILSRLQQRKGKGLVLLHGKPGTGKTSYIRYLITVLKKEIIFLPPNMAAALNNPDLLTMMVENPNSVLVIEDAENLITDRESAGGGSAPVSALLNIADGLLADCLNVQIICSFNTDISRIDKALLRKGRLIASYEFGELAPEKGQKLSDKLGFRTVINTPMTLAQIYNQSDAGFELAGKRARIGFGVGA